MQKKSYSLELKYLIVQFIRQGFQPIQIAKLLDIPSANIYRWLKDDIGPNIELLLNHQSQLFDPKYIELDGIRQENKKYQIRIEDLVSENQRLKKECEIHQQECAKYKQIAQLAIN